MTTNKTYMNIDFLLQGAHASGMTHNSVVRLLLQSRRHVATCHVLNYKGFFRPGGPELLRKASSAGCLGSQGKGDLMSQPPPPRYLQEQCKQQQPRDRGEAQETMQAGRQDLAKGEPTQLTG